MSLLRLPSRLWGSASFAFMRYVLWTLNKPTYIVLLGGPGAGKGTLAVELAIQLGLPHISTGNLFRREIANDTALGKVVKPILDSGGLVPDEITLAVLAEELGRTRNWRGAILDGFPRTVAQAQLLDNLFDGWGQGVGFAFFLDASREDLMARLSGRRICSNKDCGRTFHVVFNKPKVDGICDACSSALVQRDDDKPEVVVARIEKFDTLNGPILNHYGRAGCLHNIKTTNTDKKGSVVERVLAILDRRR